MSEIIHKTMDRTDLLTAEAGPVVSGINELIRKMYTPGVCPTSWWGTLPKNGRRKISLRDRLRNWVQRDWVLTDRRFGVGYENRGPEYEPLAGAVDDGWFPWFLYWEIYWVLRHGPRLEKHLRVLDAGGTASLFTCYLASLGVETHSVDRNPAPNVVGVGPDPREQNRIQNPADLRQNFLATDRFELVGNPAFFDNGKSYLAHPRWNRAPYTFGALFLRKK